MAKPAKEYHILVETTTRLPGKNVQQPMKAERVTGAREAARRATKLAREAGTNTSTVVTVVDADTRKNVMLCTGPMVQRVKYNKGQIVVRPARRSFVSCQIVQKAFKTALKKKRKR